MKRTPLPRYSPLRPGNPPARRTRLRRESPAHGKRRRRWRESRDAAFAARGGWCLAAIPGVCQKAAVDPHHVKAARFRDDSVRNCLPVCRACHDWIETHKAEARRLGFVVLGNSEAIRGTGTADDGLGLLKAGVRVPVGTADVDSGTPAGQVPAVHQRRVGTEPAAPKGQDEGKGNRGQIAAWLDTLGRAEIEQLVRVLGERLRAKGGGK